MAVMFWAIIGILAALTIGMMLVAISEYCSKDIERRVRLNKIKKIIVITLVFFVLLIGFLSFAFFF